MKKHYKILYLCSDLLDFDGTRGDILYFLSRLKMYDIPYEYVEHQLADTIDVHDFDFIYAGVCPQKYEALYLKHLKSNIIGLAEYIESGKTMLAIEQSFLFLANDMKCAGEQDKQLLSILPFSIQQLSTYAIGNILLDTNFIDFSSKINGFINTRYYFDLPQADTFTSLGDILLGVDFLWERKYEGLRYKNFFGTQLRGPLLPRNYDICDYLIQCMTKEDTLPAISNTLEAKAKAKLTADCEAFIESGEQKKEYIYVS